MPELNSPFRMLTVVSASFASAFSSSLHSRQVPSWASTLLKFPFLFTVPKLALAREPPRSAPKLTCRS